MAINGDDNLLIGGNYSNIQILAAADRTRLRDLKYGVSCSDYPASQGGDPGADGVPYTNCGAIADASSTGSTEWSGISFYWTGTPLLPYRYIAPGPGGSGIWFAYGFYKDRWLDPDKKYLLPQSFYFSGAPTSPPDAPFVSQNYTNFRIQKPDPNVTWNLVAKLCPARPPDCQLFEPPSGARATPGDGAGASPTRNTNWGNLDFNRPPSK